MQPVSMNKGSKKPTGKAGYSSLFSLSVDAVPFGSSFRDVPSNITVSVPATIHAPDELIQDHLDRQRKFARLVMAGQYTAALSESMAPEPSSALASLLLSDEAMTLSSTAHYVLHRQVLEWQQSIQCAQQCEQQQSGMETSEYDHPLPTRTKDDAEKQ
jgi:hypothetical protein